MKKVIHYRHPVMGYHACGMGNQLTVAMTEAISNVTCRRCLGTITGQKNGGRPVSSDSMIKSRAAWSMSADDWEWLNRQQNKSETLRNAIAHLRQQRA